MISDVITLIDFLQKRWDQYSVISAMFNWEAKCLEGDETIIVDKVPVQKQDNKWFYRIREINQYVFIYMSLIPTVHIDYGTLLGEKSRCKNL